MGRIDSLDDLRGLDPLPPPGARLPSADRLDERGCSCGGAVGAGSAPTVFPLPAFFLRFPLLPPPAQCCPPRRAARSSPGDSGTAARLFPTGRADVRRKETETKSLPRRPQRPRRAGGPASGVVEGAQSGKRLGSDRGFPEEGRPGLGCAMGSG